MDYNENLKMNEMVWEAVIPKFRHISFIHIAVYCFILDKFKKDVGSPLDFQNINTNTAYKTPM